ncbi:hypothetical protein FA95DRAFT_606345 [Auriscalpium vulgare]|uniref:Uncharacterized protein n=1 Tax=Auriscalpium vulgare TaxID=40419 RepID=A0ACB8REA3_9AGAM|nr:hypothetical protein FA95DRAFT_606345 [Auriscalpium vulgare]
MQVPVQTDGLGRVARGDAGRCGRMTRARKSGLAPSSPRASWSRVRCICLSCHWPGSSARRVDHGHCDLEAAKLYWLVHAMTRGYQASAMPVRALDEPSISCRDMFHAGNASHSRRAQETPASGVSGSKHQETIEEMRRLCSAIRSFGVCESEDHGGQVPRVCMALRQARRGAI